MKRVLYVLIPILSVLLMSHNTSAITTTFNLNNYEPVISGYFTQDCSYNDTSLNNSGNWACYLSRTDKNLRVIQTTDSFDLKLNDIITFDVIIASYGNFAVISDFSGQQTEYPGFRLISLEIEDGDYMNVFAQNSLIPTGYTIRKIYHYTYRAERDNFNHKLGVGQTYLDNFSFAFADGSTSLSGFNLAFSLKNVVVWRFSGTEENKEQLEAGEEQAQAAQDASDDSQDSVDGATTSLFSAIGSVITAIKDTNATDCVIDITTTQYTIGNVNLCQAPQGILNMVQALAALVIVPMVLMAAYSLLHKMYNAFKEVQDT